MKALHELNQEEYIKHLEEYLLNTFHGHERYDYARCEQCGRVEDQDYMNIPPHYLCGSRTKICDTCLPAWERAEKKAQEIAASDEKDYRAAKGNK